MIKWSLVANPLEGCRLEDLVFHIDNCLQFMAKKMDVRTFFSLDWVNFD